MCKQGQAILGWWWLVASVPRRPTAGHPPGMNAKVKTGAAWWRRWRSCPPLDVGEADATDRFSGVAGGGDDGATAAGEGGGRRGEEGADRGDGAAGGRGRRPPDPNPTESTGLSVPFFISENHYKRSQILMSHSKSSTDFSTTTLIFFCPSCRYR